jgi:hypothetical protein
MVHQWQSSLGYYTQTQRNQIDMKLQTVHYQTYLLYPFLMELPLSFAASTFTRRSCCCGCKQTTQYRRVSHGCIGLKPVDQSRLQWLFDSLAGFYWCRLLYENPIGVLPRSCTHHIVNQNVSFLCVSPFRC